MTAGQFISVGMQQTHSHKSGNEIITAILATKDYLSEEVLS